MKTHEVPVSVSQFYEVDISKVWSAITAPSEMRQWFFNNIPDFKAEVGFKTQFNVEAPSRDFMHKWEVVEVQFQKRLVTRWSFEGIQGASDVIMCLSSNDGGTTLTLTDKILENFEGDYPEFKRESCMEGWKFFIQKQLLEYIT